MVHLHRNGVDILLLLVKFNHEYKGIDKTLAASIRDDDRNFCVFIYTIG